MKGIKSVFLALIPVCLTAGIRAQDNPAFKEINIEKSCSLHPEISDIDRDGINDIVLVTDYVDDKGDDRDNIKNLCWIKSPGFEKIKIASVVYRSCGMAVSDMDNDGYPDIIGLEDLDGIDSNGNSTLFIFYNPGSKGQEWKRSDIGKISYAKDISTGDLNGDGFRDIIARTDDRKIHIYSRDHDAWMHTQIEVPPFDGLAIGDMDQDGDDDLVINGMWLENDAGKWTAHDYDKTWYTQKTGEKGQWNDNNTRIAVGDIDGNGRPDIVISESEQYGYPLTWYENPVDPANMSAWKGHKISNLDHLHSLRLADFNNDGELDIMTGRLIFGGDNVEDPHPVLIYYNENKGSGWHPQVLSEEGCYGANAGDIDGDGDIDVVFPRNYDLGPVSVYLNLLNDNMKKK